MPQFFPFGPPGDPDQTDSNQPYTLGVPWSTDTVGVVSGNRWRAPTNAPLAQCRMCLFRVSDMALLAQSALFTPSLGVDNDILFTASFEAAAGVDYLSGVVTDRYVFTNPGGFPYNTTNLVTAGTGRFGFTTASVPVFPTNVSPSNYHVSPLFDARMTINLTPTVISLAPTALAPAPGMVMVDLSPTVIALSPVPAASLTGDLTEPGVATPGGTAPTLTPGGTAPTLTPSGRP